MLEKVKAVMKKMKGVAESVTLPRTAKSLDEVSLFFKKERVTSVKIELACYKTITGPRKLTIDYIGVGRKKRVVRREVLRTIKDHNADVPLLMQEMRNLFPVIREKAEKLKNYLGVVVTIPEQFMEELTVSPSHATTRSDIPI